MCEKLDQINKESAQLMTYVKQESIYWRSKGKKTILLGGDHSTSLGHIEACASDDLGILQIDAHADFRKAYEGFTYSHASIMYNVLDRVNVERLVQVGIRDYCEEEFNRIELGDLHVKCFFDQAFKRGTISGQNVASAMRRNRISFTFKSLFVSRY